MSMGRTIWFVAGAGAGVYAMTRARRAAEVLTPEGLADRLAGLSLGVRLFRDEVAAGAADKETELRERLQLVPHGGPRALAASRSPGRDDGSTRREDGSTDREDREGDS